MKQFRNKIRITLKTLVLVLLGFTVRAQCELSKPVIELKNLRRENGSCAVTFNYSFEMDRNNGNKYGYIHLWTNDQYPGLDYNGPSDAPSATDLAQSLGTIVINTNTSPVSLLNTYPPDNQVKPLNGLQIRETIINGNTSLIQLEQITVFIPGACNNLPDLTSDVWSSQANNGKVVHCAQAGLNLSVDNPKVSGQFNCRIDAESQRTYNLNLSTDQTQSLPLTYQVYVDNGTTDGVFDIADELVFTSTTIEIDASNPLDLKNQPFSYSDKEDKPLWVVVSGPTLTNSILSELPINCEALPVKLTKFNGNLLDDRVELYWETVEEFNSGLFQIERSKDAIEFRTLGYMEATGQSIIQQSYQFSDMNPGKGLNYYRLKIVDQDGSYAYSRSISVNNGTDDLGFQLLGNPANNNIRFLLNNFSPENLSLTDLSGRPLAYHLIQEVNAYTLIPSQPLIPGLYLLSITTPYGRLTKKVVVNTGEL